MSSAERVLVVAPHPDDETIGVGGTIARHAAAGAHVTVAIMTGHGSEGAHPIWPEGHWDAVTQEAQRACDILGVADIVYANLPAVTIADMPLWKLNQATQKLLEQCNPTTLYVPFPNDLHKDHRELFHSFSIAWRPSSEVGRQVRDIYCYEVQSETHWNIPYVEAGFLPNTFVDVSDHMDQKLEAFKQYTTQVKPPPDARSLEAIAALATWRGSLCGCHAAEGLVAVRRVV